jgi:hypothetical protein
MPDHTSWRPRPREETCIVSIKAAHLQLQGLRLSVKAIFNTLRDVYKPALHRRQRKWVSAARLAADVEVGATAAAAAAAPPRRTWQHKNVQISLKSQSIEAL